MQLKWIAPVALAALACGFYVGLDVRPVDLVGSDFRADLVADHGILLWNGDWYGGHYLLTYSVIAPPLAALVGSTALEIAAAIVSAALFTAIASRHFGPSAWLGAAWFGLAAATDVFHGRVAFALGGALGLAAVAALQRQHAAIAAVLAVLTCLASPVAGLFLAIAALAAAIADRRRDALATAAAAITPAILLSLAFPEDGEQIYHPHELIELLAACAVVALVASRQRAVRIGALLYAAAGVAAYVVHTPLGNNVVRLAALAAGPLIACVLAGRRLPKAAIAAAVLVLAAFAYAQWRPAIRDIAKVHGDPASHAAYYAPLNAFLDRHPGAYRTEIPFTRAHGEAAEVARKHPLARGWQRQLDIARNGLFYGHDPLNATTYARWLSENGVRFVALPDAILDSSSYDEAKLVESGLPYLRPVWRSAHWRVYAFTGPHALGPVQKLGVDSAQITGPGVVKLRWSQYWKLDGGCVERAGNWTRVMPNKPGPATLKIVFAPGRLVAHGRRCG